MATEENFTDQQADPPGASATGSPEPFKTVLRQLFAPLASLYLTVLLFALSILLILVGTLAQDKMDMWAVIAQYFRALFVRLDVGVFFPTQWFPGLEAGPQRMLVALAWFVTGAAIAVPVILQSRGRIGRILFGAASAMICIGLAVQSVTVGWFWFPGGATIGGALCINLVAAHAIRFRVQARGMRLLGGLAVLAIGVLITWVVIASGHNKEGLQDVPDFEWVTLWMWFKIGLTGLGVGLLGTAAYMAGRGVPRIVELIALSVTGGLLMLTAAYLWLAGDDAYLGDSGMRILWQLTQSSLAGGVLLVGCLLIFKRRGGVVLIHAGLGLLMFGEWFVSMYAVEEQMRIVEGQTMNYGLDIRETELSIVDPSYSDVKDNVFAVPESLLHRSLSSGKPIRDDELPFDIQVLKYFPNSDVRSIKPDEENPATKGHGVNLLAVPFRGSGGADSNASVDRASTYVTLTAKGSGEPLGTYMLSQLLSAQDLSDSVQSGGKTYDIGLRFKRIYKPYSIQLVDVRKDDYIGTDTPRNYSSDVILIDPERGTNREIRIWMNNPLRYAGETFYQSGYVRDPRTGKEMTTLQVVTNTGWMIPYVACMLVVIGMLPHFSGSLLRFLRRQQRLGESGSLPEVADAQIVPAGKNNGRSERRRKQRDEAAASTSLFFRPTILLPAIIVALVTLWLVSAAMPKRPAGDQFDLVAFGKLPLADHGRVKPIDTLARTSLRKISDRDRFEDKQGQKRPAVQWLLDMVARPEVFDTHKVFRIHNLEVLDTLGLERRKGFRYSLAEIRGSGGEMREELAKFDRQVDAARKKDAEDLTFYDRKVLKVDGRFRTFTGLLSAFRPLDFPEFPSEAEFAADEEAAVKRLQEIRRLMAAASQSEQMLARISAPLAVPILDAKESADPEQPAKPWIAYASAHNKAYFQKNVLHKEVDPATAALTAIFDAYGEGDKARFNREVAKYRRWLAENPPDEYGSKRVGFEAYFNGYSPYTKGTVLYVVAFVLAALAWLFWRKPLNYAALGILVVTFVLHTLVLAGRVYISGRPPVTNLYSSAVFIGWAIVLLGIILELIYRIGVGNVIAAVAGFVTLLIARQLAMDSDTFTVMQAVLDTQFWLATHVVCITLGYATTFAAGLLGIMFVVLGFFTPALQDEDRKNLGRMMYGIVCFSIFFSFFGTVLGGLWADDSWGRFWGWDPKENGALIIVLWNVIILHARWGGMVRERGLALLCIGGNIVTAWSWFGVNELGVGLHSYGFTEGVLLALGLFVLSQVAVIILGSMPLSVWVSYRERQNGDLAKA